jgi:hypothetical protein
MLQPFSRKDFMEAIGSVMIPGIRSATVFCYPLENPKQRIRATLRGKNQIVITYGKPNYDERMFIKKELKTSSYVAKIKFIHKKKKKK